MNKPYSFIEINFASPLCDEFLKLRFDALRAPLNMEFETRDISSEWCEHHLVCLDANHQLIGGLMLKRVSNSTIKMRQVAVVKHLRGFGLGKRLVGFSEKWAQKRAYSTITLHARKEVVSFYISLDYIITSDEFMEVGIPHYRMMKQIIPKDK